MNSQYDLTEHDLSLTFDGNGRLWKFRPATAVHGHQPVGAGIVDNMIVVTVDVPGIAPGDVDLRANGHVLEIRGKTDLTMDLACDVAMPMAFGLDQLGDRLRRPGARHPRAAAGQGPEVRRRRRHRDAPDPSRDHPGGRLATSARLKTVPPAEPRRGGRGAVPLNSLPAPASTYGIGPSR